MIFIGTFPKVNQDWKYNLKSNTVRMSYSRVLVEILLPLQELCFYSLQERMEEWCGFRMALSFYRPPHWHLQSVNNEYDLLLCWQINCWQGWLSNNYDSITPLNSLLPNMLHATTAVILPDMSCMQKDGRKKLCAKFRCSRILLLPDTKTLS